jgi:hypothetical protein
MDFHTQDPNGDLNAGTRWTIKYGTLHTVRVIHGLYLSGIREDDLVIWTIEKHGVLEGRPYSGRRQSFHRWEPAKAPVFELGHTYRHNEDLVGEVGALSRFLVLHVAEGGDMVGRVITLKDGEHVVEMTQEDRCRFEDVTGKDAER